MRRITGVIAVLAIAATALAQFDVWNRYGRSRYPPRFREAGQIDDGFSFCRLMYPSFSNRRRGGRWSTDYPLADINFMIRFSEMTSTHVNFDEQNEPNHWVVPILDDGLFACPFVIGSAVGSMSLSQADGERLRTYLLKGGFLWVDDFWGSYRVGAVGVRDQQGVAPRGVSDRRPISDTRDLSDDVPYLGSPSDLEHRILATLWGLHVGTRRGQRGATLPGDL